MAIKVSNTGLNGILFDLSTNEGAGTNGQSKFVFRPKYFNSIIQINVCDDFMKYVTIENKEFLFSYNGEIGSQMSEINGVATTDNYDMFNKFIALM
jgi:hypothetical protein